MISTDELLVHGGCLSGGFSGGPCPSADSWLYSYSKNRWEKVDSSCVSPRKYSSMASLVSDKFRQSAIMFSGEENDKTIISVINWILNEINDCFLNFLIFGSF